MRDPEDPIVHVLDALVGDSQAPVAAVPPERALELVAAARTERLLGPLLRAVDAGDIAIPLAADAALIDAQRETQAWCLRVEARLLEVEDWFATAGEIRHVVLKGPAVAHLDEADPSLRSFADLDLLVATDDLERAVAILDRNGVRRRWAERRPGYDRRFAKSVTTVGGDGIEVDVHRTLCDGPHGRRIPLGSVLADAETWVLSGRPVLALTATRRVLHAAYHLSLGATFPPRRVRRDLAVQLAGAADAVKTVVAEARQWGGEAVLVDALDQLVTLHPTTVPKDWRSWSTRARPDIEPHERDLVALQRRQGSSFGWATIAAIREEPRRAQRIAWAYALAIPTHAHLATRGVRRFDRLPGMRSSAPD